MNAIAAQKTLDTTENNRKVVVSKTCFQKKLTLIDSYIADPQANEVQIRVKAAGVSFADLMVREGLYPGIDSHLVTPGYDVAGIVEKVGLSVTRIQVGDAVVALTKTGGYTETINVPEALAVKQPEGLDQVEAVSLVLNYLTAYQLLHRSARIRDGEAILIHGAAGGVGSALLQLGQLSNLDMWGTASRGKHELVRALGGKPIDYHSDDFVEIVKQGKTKGVDAVFDPIGGSNWRRSYQALRLGGKVVGYGFSEAIASGRLSVTKAIPALLATPRFSFYKMYQQNKGMLGYFIWDLNNERLELYQEDMTKLLTLLKEKKIAPIIGEIFPLEDAQKVHLMLNESKVSGKIVLEC